MKRLVIKKVDSYDVEKIKKTILTSLEDLGGIDRFIKKDMKIALKPNLVMKKSPDHAVTTHPSIVQAIGEIIKDQGAKAILIESPGGPFNKLRLKNNYDMTGMSEACKKAGIELNYDLETVQIKNQEALFMKNLTIVEAFERVDAIINLPKLKTHGQMVYTGAVKNMFGIVPGIIKTEHHFRSPSYDDFADLIIDIFISRKPILNIMDAIEAMEGAGPAAGDVKKLDALIISDDAFFLDYFTCKIIELIRDDVPVLRQAVKRGYLKTDLDKEETKLVERFKCHGFKIPSRDNPKVIDFSDHTPSGKFIKLLKPKPVFDHKKCVLCGDCIRSCPANVLSEKKKKIFVDLAVCIRCYCCQELCPERAVKIKRGIVINTFLKIDKMFNGGKKQ